MVLADIGTIYMRSTKFGRFPITTGLFEEPLLKAVLIGNLIFLIVRWTLTALYSTVAAATVLLHLYDPQDFPPLFGDWKDAYSVRRFWA